MIIKKIITPIHSHVVITNQLLSLYVLLLLKKKPLLFRYLVSMFTNHILIEYLSCRGLLHHIYPFFHNLGASALSISLASFIVHFTRFFGWNLSPCSFSSIFEKSIYFFSFRYLCTEYIHRIS